MVLNVSKPMRLRRKKDMDCAGQRTISESFCTAEIVKYNVNGHNSIQVKIRKGHESSPVIDYNLSYTLVLFSDDMNVDDYMDSILENFNNYEIVYDKDEVKELRQRLKLLADNPF